MSVCVCESSVSPRNGKRTPRHDDDDDDDGLPSVKVSTRELYDKFTRTVAFQSYLYFSFLVTHVPAIDDFDIIRKVEYIIRTLTLVTLTLTLTLIPLSPSP